MRSYLAEANLLDQHLSGCYSRSWQGGRLLVQQRAPGLVLAQARLRAVVLA